ncbi:MAG TPA: peptide ABC transporter substrate-binding protein [Thermomicrobiaceae bacterium]|nr:peptide ABC transporter substrate-binding protein [Thermomicrobiaceae bacterium]
MANDREIQVAVSRRQFMKLAGLLGGGAALAALLEACGSSTSTATQSSSSGTATQAAGGAAATTSGTQAAQATSASNVKLAADQVIRYIDTEPTHMDPGLTTSLNDLQIIENVWEGLLDFDDKGNTIPLGATNWDISDDGTVYTFHLRDGVKWTDGTPITAHDYEWTWKRNLDPKTASDYAQALFPVKNGEAFNTGKASIDDVGVKAVDDKTFQVTLEGPAGYFLRICSTWTAFPLPKQTIEKNAEKWVEAANVISNGPFKITEWNHDQQITLERNDGYWGDKPTITKITIKLTTDIPKTSLPAYENDELDFAIGPWPADMQRIQGDPKLSKELVVYPRSSTSLIVCDSTNPNSPVGKADFRRALYLGIDRDTIVKNVFNGIYKPAYTVLPPDIMGHNDDARIPGGLQEAKDAVAKAGYPNGSGVEITLVYSQTSTNDLLAQVLQQMWHDNLGITLKLQPMESKAYTAYNKTLATAHFDLKFGTWISDYLDPFDWHNFLFKSDTDFFHSHWSNPDFDKLVDQAAVLSDQAKRKDLHQQAEKILVNDAAYIPMYNSTVPYLIKPYITDHDHSATGFDMFTSTKVAQH